MRSLGRALASLPRWVLALPAFGAGIAATRWLDVVPQDTVLYLGALAAIEAFVSYRAWIRSPRARTEIVEAEIVDTPQIEGPP